MQLNPSKQHFITYISAMQIASNFFHHYIYMTGVNKHWSGSRYYIPAWDDPRVTSFFMSLHPEGENALYPLHLLVHFVPHGTSSQVEVALPWCLKLCFLISMKYHIKVPLDPVAVFCSRFHSLDMKPIVSNLIKNLKLNYPHWLNQHLHWNLKWNRHWILKQESCYKTKDYMSLGSRIKFR